MTEEQVKKISLKLFVLQNDLNEIKDLKEIELIEKKINSLVQDIKKIDAELLVSNNLKFSNKEKEKVFEYAKLLK